MRRYLTSLRKSRKYLERVLIMGGVQSAKPLINRLEKNPELGYEVVGLCVPVEKLGTPETLESRLRWLSDASLEKAWISTRRCTRA